MRRFWLKSTGIVFVIFLVVLLAARAAEPSIRPVLYEARPSLTLPTTTVAPTTTLAKTTNDDQTATL